MPPTKFNIFFQDFYLSKVPIVGQLEPISYNTLLLLQKLACMQTTTNKYFSYFQHAILSRLFASSALRNQV
jgi:hypothetical protein